MTNIIDDLAKVFTEATFAAYSTPLQWDTLTMPEQAAWRAGVVALLKHLFDHPTEEMLRGGAEALAAMSLLANNADAQAVWRGALECLLPRTAADEPRVAAGVRAAREVLEEVYFHGRSGPESFTSLLRSHQFESLVRAILAAADKEKNASASHIYRDDLGEKR